MIKTYSYVPQGTCSRLIEIAVDTDTMTVADVRFTGGCNGNLKGIGSLVRGMKLDEVINRLQGTTCGAKATSCPDQLACALSMIKAG